MKRPPSSTSHSTWLGKTYKTLRNREKVESQKGNVPSGIHELITQIKTDS